MGSNITCFRNCTHRVAGNFIYLRYMVCFRYIIVNTPHKGYDYDDDNNNNNNK
jgi:hypothetical protein